jgi:DNA-binding transcriptional ArsR family regulator
MKLGEIQFAKNLDALKSPQCRRIVKALYVEDLAVSEPVRICKLTEGSVEKHLEVLTSAELVSATASLGKYSLNSGAFSETHDWFVGLGK